LPEDHRIAAKGGARNAAAPIDLAMIRFGAICDDIKPQTSNAD
jgi:hypothetical protein